MTNPQPANHFRVAVNKLFFALLLLLSSTALVHADIVINEFMASNSTGITDENGDHDDWVELYNNGLESVDIGGWSMSDDLGEPDLSLIPTGDPATIIPAGEFLIVWFDKETEQGPLHINAKLGSSGEDIVLFNGSDIVDSHSFGQQEADISEGRLPDGTGSFIPLSSASPGAVNQDTPPVTNIDAIEFSQAGGVFESAVSISLSSTTSDVQIHFTTDGSDPTQDDTLYSTAISIDTPTVIRARAFANGLDPSPITTQTYLVGVTHDFMILSTSANPELFYDEDFGMFPNFKEDIEINVNLEIFETDGNQVINQMVESEIQGTASAELEQKSLAYKAKASLGDGDLSYPLFSEKPLSNYMSIVGRNSGQDFNATMFRDAMVSSLIRDLSDVEGMITPTSIDIQAYRPAVTYLNGEYYGITNLRERTDRRYIEANYGLDKNQIDLLENDVEIKEGDLDAWNDLLSLIRNNDISSDDNFATLASMVDVENYTDYLAFQVFIDNTDWPGNNTRRWRERSEDGKWRWMLYDLDFTFGLHTLGSPWKSGDPNGRSLDRLLVLNGFQHPNQDWSTELFRAMNTNTNWRNKFINRLADQMNVLYTSERMNTRLDDFHTTYTSGVNERQLHADLYSFGWNEEIVLTKATMATFINGDGASYPLPRSAVVKQHIVDAYNDIPTSVELTLTSNPAGAGNFAINTISLDANQLPWTGTYFANVNVPVSTTAARGYFFDSWSTGATGSNTNLNFTPSQDSQLVANFTQGSVSTAAIVINEINYNSSDDSDSGDWVELYNPGSQAVDISGWYFEDESDDFFGLPQNTIIPAGGYLVLVADSVLFTSIFPNVVNFIGDFGADPGGFGLSGKGEHVYLYNAAGQLIDDVDFDDKAPWPEGPDGDGETLQLSSANLDNNQPDSWFGALGSAGKSNMINTGPAQTISFAPIADKTMLDGSFNLTASADSGLPVSFSISSGSASISGNTITLTGTGTVTVVATQSGNASFDPATPVSQSFNVSLAENEISFAALVDRVETDAPFTLNATSSSGLPISYAIVSGPISLFGNTVTLLNTGTVIIEASQAGNSLYAAATSVQQSFTITPAIIGPVSYCEAKAEQPWNAWITDVSLNDLVHASWKDQYGDYTDESASLTKGSVTAFNLTATLSWISETLHYKVWIDYNHNGVFEEGAETALYVVNPQTVMGAPTDSLVSNIAVPATATSGTTRMRISMGWNEEPTPCDNHDKGEVNDFTVSIN